MEVVDFTRDKGVISVLSESIARDIGENIGLCTNCNRVGAVKVVGNGSPRHPEVHDPTKELRVYTHQMTLDAEGRPLRVVYCRWINGHWVTEAERDG